MAKIEMVAIEYSGNTYYAIRKTSTIFRRVSYKCLYSEEYYWEAKSSDKVIKYCTSTFEKVAAAYQALGIKKQRDLLVVKKVISPLELMLGSSDGKV